MATLKSPNDNPTATKDCNSSSIVSAGKRTYRDLGSVVKADSSYGKADLKHHKFDLFARLVSENDFGGIKAVNSIRNGYPVEILKSAGYFFDVPDSRIYIIVQVPASTASRLKKNHAKIDSAATERIYRMGAVARMAIDIFENKDSAIEWMRQPNHSLGDVAPLDLMDTEPGAATVRQVLNAIATGGVA